MRLSVGWCPAFARPPSATSPPATRSTTRSGAPGRPGAAPGGRTPASRCDVRRARGAGTRAAAGRRPTRPGTRRRRAPAAPPGRWRPRRLAAGVPAVQHLRDATRSGLAAGRRCAGRSRFPTATSTTSRRQARRNPSSSLPLIAAVGGCPQAPRLASRVSGLVFEELTDAPVDYVEAWERQREVHAGVVAGGPGTVLLLEHPPVYTAGKRTEPHERPSRRHAGHRGRPRRQDHLPRPRPAGRLPDRPAARPRPRRRLRAPPRGGTDRRLHRPRRRHGARPRSQRRLAAGRARAVRSARSPRWASGSAVASPCTASR